MIINKISSPYHNVLLGGLGCNVERYRGRNPAFHVKNTNDFHVASSINGNKNFGINAPVDLNKWICVEVSQTIFLLEIRTFNMLKAKGPANKMKTKFSSRTFFLIPRIKDKIWKLWNNGHLSVHVWIIFLWWITKNSVENTKPIHLEPVRVYNGDSSLYCKFGKV